jgi:hypothetical protein
VDQTRSMRACLSRMNLTLASCGAGRALHRIRFDTGCKAAGTSP